MIIDQDHAKSLLLADIEAEARDVAAATGRDRLSPRVMTALERVPRAAFVPAVLQAMAWGNRPLPIGHEQTISQPFIVALMTDLLDLAPTDRVLEIGTGSGYQAALLAELAAEIYTVERIAELSHRARSTLTALGYTNISFRIGDGHAGWPEHAPFDAIIVTAAARRPPAALIEQLAPSGRMIIPIGEAGLWPNQTLTFITKAGDGTVDERPLLGVAFVPLVEGKGGTS